MTRVVASIEARMNSSRLPGKVLADVNGIPALTRLVRRLKLCKNIHDIVLATSTNDVDNELSAWAESVGLSCYRGSEHDVLQRVVDAHNFMDSEVIVEITGDCILSDPGLIDMTILTFFENDADVVSSISKRGFPMGAGAQVFRLSNLEKVAKTIDDTAVREHVSLYFYENPDLYKIIYLMPPPVWFEPEWRFQIDYPEDLEFTKEIYKRLEPKFGDAFSISDIVEVCRKEPHLPKINSFRNEKPARTVLKSNSTESKF